jgi:NitT/TauT family transport system substrate-binding protein
VAGLLAAALLLPGVASAQAQTEAPKPTSLRIYGAAQVVELAPILLAVSKLSPGTPVHNGGVGNLVSAENTADVAGNAETQALRHSVKRPDVRIIMSVVDGDYRIVARSSAGISKLSDLKGKKIAAMKATSSEYFLYKMLKHAGLTESDVTIVNLVPKNMVAAIEKKEVDAVAIWEPWSENALLALGNDHVEFSGKGVYFEHYNLNTTAGVLADPVKRREVVALVRAIIEATEEMKKNPAEAQAMVAKSGGYTVEEISRSWKHHTWTASFADDMLDVLTEEEAWLAGKENRTPRTRAELAPMIDRSVYEEAKAK